LVLGAVFSLVGWVVTLGAMCRLREPDTTANVAQPSEGTGHVPAEA